MIGKVLDNESVRECNIYENGNKNNNGSSNTSRKDTKCELVTKTSKDNSKVAPDFSPDTMDVMKRICGDTPGQKAKPAPKKSTKRKSNNGTKGEISSPKQRKRTPNRKKGNNSRDDSALSSPCNDSALSDYVPPTPPDPNRTVGTRTPNRSTLTGRTESPAVHKAKKESTSMEFKLKSDVKTKVSAPDEEKTDTLDTSPPVPLTCQSFTIIDTAANKVLFNHFIDEWHQRDIYALSLACEKIPTQPTEVGRIGANFNKGIHV